VVDELRQFTNVYILITSRISIVPPVKRKEIPSLPCDAASKIFCSIRGVETASAVTERLLEKLEVHALSITLLATVALQNWWDDDRLAGEWETQRTRILLASRHSKSDPANSLAATIDLSLGPPMFVALGAVMLGRSSKLLRSFHKALTRETPMRVSNGRVRPVYYRHILYPFPDSQDGQFCDDARASTRPLPLQGSPLGPAPPHHQVSVLRPSSSHNDHIYGW